MIKKLRETPLLPLLISFTLLGFILRLYGIGNEAIWVDEAISISQTSRGLGEALYLLQTDVHPPLYTVLLWAWTNLVGNTEVAVRTLSAILGTLLIPITYQFGNYLSSKRTGILTAYLVTINPFLILYSQEARMYSLYILLSVLSTMYAYTYFKTSNKTKYLITTTLLIYTHYLAWILIIAQGLYLFIKKPEDVTQHLFIGGVLASTYLPWSEYLWKQAQNMGGVSWIPNVTYESTIEAILSFVGGHHVFPLILFLLLVATLYIYRGQEETLIASVTITSLTLIILLSTFTPLFVSRYIAYLSPFLLYIASVGLKNLTQKKYMILTSLLLITLLTIPSITTIYTERTNPSWDKVAEELPPSQNVGVLPDYEMFPLLYYANPSCFTQRIHFENNQTRSDCSNITGYTSPENIEEDIILVSQKEIRNKNITPLITRRTKNITYKNSPPVTLYYEE